MLRARLVVMRKQGTAPRLCHRRRDTTNRTAIGHEPEVHTGYQFATSVPLLMRSTEGTSAALTKPSLADASLLRGHHADPDRSANFRRNPDRSARAAHEHATVRCGQLWRMEFALAGMSMGSIFTVHAGGAAVVVVGGAVVSGPLPHPVAIAAMTRHLLACMSVIRLVRKVHRMETDVVCGMRVEPATAAGSAKHDGTIYYFCGKGCLQRFQADPGKYLDPAYRPGMHAMRPHATAAPLTLVKQRPQPGTFAPRTLAPSPPHPRTLAPEYPLPNDPRSSARPGSADLVMRSSVEVSLDGDRRTKSRDIFRRFGWSLALTMPMSLHGSEFCRQAAQHLVSRRAKWTNSRIATPVLLWGLAGLRIRLASVVSLPLTVTLIRALLGAAFGYSVVSRRTGLFLLFPNHGDWGLLREARGPRRPLLLGGSSCGASVHERCVRV